MCVFLSPYLDWVHHHITQLHLPFFSCYVRDRGQDGKEEGLGFRVFSGFRFTHFTYLKPSSSVVLLFGSQTMVRSILLQAYDAGTVVHGLVVQWFMVWW